MSRDYEVTVTLEAKLTPEEWDVAIEAAQTVWPFEDWPSSPTKTVHMSTARSQFSGGLTRAGFARRLSRVIWEAAGKFVKVTVHAIPLNPQVEDEFVHGEVEYRAWRAECEQPS